LPGSAVTELGLAEDGKWRQAGRVGRDLEHDVKALADRARGDRGFSVELYGALCNAEWRHADGTDWAGGTWRYVAGVVADLRGCGEDYLDFYCSGGEGEITGRVAAAMEALGWHGHGDGARLRKIDFAMGTVEVLGDDGEWAVESRGVAD
jgi:transposase InsO family protein